jgi:hypothetical protein
MRISTGEIEKSLTEGGKSKLAAEPGDEDTETLPTREPTSMLDVGVGALGRMVDLVVVNLVSRCHPGPRRALAGQETWAAPPPQGTLPMPRGFG